MYKQQYKIIEELKYKFKNIVIAKTDIQKEQVDLLEYCDNCLSYVVEEQQNNDIFICELCDSAIHQKCFGSELTHKIFQDDEPWLCGRCKYIYQQYAEEKILVNFDEVKCCFCPNLKGIIKKIEIEGQIKWCHVSCATGLYRKFDCFLKDKITKIEQNYNRNIEENQACNICQQEIGKLLKCQKTMCLRYFHVHCGRENGIVQESIMSEQNNENIPFAFNCLEHLDSYSILLAKQQQNVQKQNKQLLVYRSGEKEEIKVKQSYSLQKNQYTKIDNPQQQNLFQTKSKNEEQSINNNQNDEIEIENQIEEEQQQQNSSDSFEAFQKQKKILKKINSNKKSQNKSQGFDNNNNNQELKPKTVNNNNEMFKSEPKAGHLQQSHQIEVTKKIRKKKSKKLKNDTSDDEDVCSLLKLDQKKIQEFNEEQQKFKIKSDIIQLWNLENKSYYVHEILEIMIYNFIKKKMIELDTYSIKLNQEKLKHSQFIEILKKNGLQIDPEQSSIITLDYHQFVQIFFMSLTKTEKNDDFFNTQQEREQYIQESNDF